MFLGEELLKFRVDVLGHALYTCFVELVIILSPLGKELWIVVWTGVRVVLPELLLNIDVSQLTHLPWQLLAVQFQDVVI